MQEIKEKFFNRLKDLLGVTDYWTAAGYLLPDGILLSFADENLNPDITQRVYAHSDLDLIFHCSQDDLLRYGGILVGYCEATDRPYVKIDLSENIPTTKQWSMLNELLNTEPYTIDLEMNKTSDNRTAFYKRYTIEDSSTTMKRDMNNYINGDTTYLGTFCERLGIPDPIN